MLRPAAPTPLEPATPRDAMLSKACEGDAKCSCIVEAIAIHESGFGKNGVGGRSFNPCNLRKPGSWTPEGISGETAGAVGSFLTFKTLQYGLTACAQVYKRFYDDRPYSILVSRWTAGGGNANYRAAVKSCY